MASRAGKEIVGEGRLADRDPTSASALALPAAELGRLLALESPPDKRSPQESLVNTPMMKWAAVATLGLSALAWAQSAPPPSGEAQQIEALVNRAAALVESQGKVAAFAQFRTRNSEWWSGSTYLFVYDKDLNVLLNPAFPQREGTNVHGQTDANGKPMHDEFMKVVRTQGAGWVDYVFPKPGESKPSQKWTYVKGVKIDGTPGLIGAGFYPGS